VVERDAAAAGVAIGGQQFEIEHDVFSGRSVAAVVAVSSMASP
jgi:hypothetical protein